MKNLLLQVCLLIAFPSLAQEKITLAILPFTSDDSRITKKYTQSATGIVEKSFVSTRRFTMVDRAGWNKYMAEIEKQKDASFLDGKIVKMGRQIGAQYVCLGQVSSLSVEEKKNTNTVSKIIKVSDKDKRKMQAIEESSGKYKAEVTLELKLGSVEEGQITDAESITAIGSGQTQEVAKSAAIKQLGVEVEEWIRQNFPLTGVIVEIMEQHPKKGAIKVMINIGQKDGVSFEKGVFGASKGKIKVVELFEKEIPGKGKQVLQQTIGMLKVTDIQSEVAICSVSSGGVEIAEKFKSNNDKLRIVTGD